MSVPNEPKNPESRQTSNPPNGGDLLDYFKNHTRETIAYILLVLGLLLLFYEPIYGGLLVGIVAGIYFGDEVIDYLKNWKFSVNTRQHYVEVARHLITAGLAIAFFISAPAIFLGAAISIGIKQLFIAKE